MDSKGMLSEGVNWLEPAWLGPT